LEVKDSRKLERKISGNWKENFWNVQNLEAIGKSKRNISNIGSKTSSLES